MNNIVGLSKIGLVRKQNEDRFLLAITFVLSPTVWVAIEVEKLPAPMRLMK